MTRALCLLAFVFGPNSVSAAGYDILITNARIIDGTGAASTEGGVAIKERRIVAVGRVTGDATVEIDARGRVVAPGFIDVHTHAEKIAGTPMAENFIRMGVTTIVTGNCGGSRTDVAEFLGSLEGEKVAINVATLVGHNSVRQRAMGGNLSRAPTP